MSLLSFLSFFRNGRYPFTNSALAASLFLCLIGNDRYASAAELPSDWEGGITIGFDNDAFSGQDDHYTNGLQLSVISHGVTDHRQGPLGERIGSLLAALPGQSDDGRAKFVSLSVAQRIFTPEDITDTEYIADDMPYSGHLVFGIAATAQSVEHLDAWSLHIGVNGPAALAAESQELVHEILDGDDPQGWEHQLDNELVLGISYEHRWRWFRRGSDRWAVDSLVTAGGSLSTLLTQGHVGIGLRTGYQLPTDFAVPPPFLGEAAIGSRPTTERCDCRQSIYLYAMADASLIGHATFWDGPLLRDGPSISRDAGMTRIHIGLHYDAPVLSADLAFVIQSVPWDNPSGYDTDSYGRINLTFRL